MGGVVFHHLLHSGLGGFELLVVGVNLALHLVQAAVHIAAENDALPLHLAGCGAEGVDVPQQVFQLPEAVYFGVDVVFPLLKGVSAHLILLQHILQILIGARQCKEAVALLAVEHYGILLALLQPLVHLRPRGGALRFVAAHYGVQVGAVVLQLAVEVGDGIAYIGLLRRRLQGKQKSCRQYRV